MGRANTHPSKGRTPPTRGMSEIRSLKNEIKTGTCWWGPRIHPKLPAVFAINHNQRPAAFGNLFGDMLRNIRWLRSLIISRSYCWTFPTRPTHRPFLKLRLDKIHYFNVSFCARRGKELREQPPPHDQITELSLTTQHCPRKPNLTPYPKERPVFGRWGRGLTGADTIKIAIPRLWRAKMAWPSHGLDTPVDVPYSLLEAHMV